MDIIANLTRALKSAFPTTTFFSAFGNHDYYPANQYPATVPHDLDNFIYNSTAELWRSWIVEEEQMQNFRKGKCLSDLGFFNVTKKKINVFP
jgi:hypothetical protein